VLGVRETPLHSGHLCTLLQLSDMGAVVAPLVPAFYSRPQSIEHIVDHTVGRLLDLFDVETDIVKRWKQG
jgi:4-hydroxy-3-polyprenylbenzoate decarboxylase